MFWLLYLLSEGVVFLSVVGSVGVATSGALRASAAADGFEGMAERRGARRPRRSGASLIFPSFINCMRSAAFVIRWSAPCFFLASDRGRSLDRLFRTCGISPLDCTRRENLRMTFIVLSVPVRVISTFNMWQIVYPNLFKSQKKREISNFCIIWKFDDVLSMKQVLL